MPEREGWRYVWMSADGRDVVHGPEPLPVPILAATPGLNLAADLSRLARFTD